MAYIPRMNRDRYPSALAFAREMGMPYKKVLDMCHAGQLPHLPFDKNLKQPKIWMDKERYLADEEKFCTGQGFHGRKNSRIRNRLRLCRSHGQGRHGRGLLFRLRMIFLPGCRVY